MPLAAANAAAEAQSISAFVASFAIVIAGLIVVVVVLLVVGFFVIPP
jgi:hypothetical protein